MVGLFLGLPLHWALAWLPKQKGTLLLLSLLTSARTFANEKPENRIHKNPNEIHQQKYKLPQTSFLQQFLYVRQETKRLKRLVYR